MLRADVGRNSLRASGADWLHGGRCVRAQPLCRLPDFAGAVLLPRAADCAGRANGSSWNIAKAVFDALGATTLVINAEPNGLNINRDAGSTHIGGLQKFVVENHCDVGFAFDGDADRCLCVDETGMEITGDHILFICGRHMKQTGELLGNTVVATVMSNLGLFRRAG